MSTTKTEMSYHAPDCKEGMSRNNGVLVFPDCEADILVVDDTAIEPLRYQVLLQCINMEECTIIDVVMKCQYAYLHVPHPE